MDAGEGGAAAVFRGLFELTRPGNVAAAGALTFTGSFVASGFGAAVAPVVAAVAATGFATAAGNAVNDYFDRAVDRVNRPERPIPRGAVTARTALVFSGLLFLGAVVAAVALPLAAVAIAVANLLALLAYTKLFKGLPGVGNVVVAYLTGSTFLFGAAAVGRVADPAAVVLFALAALATLSREVVKDVEDTEGDRAEGLRTLPIVAGERTALRVGAAVLVAAVAASAIPYAMGTFGPAYVAVVLPADLVMLDAIRLSFTDPGVAQRRLKRGMFLAAVAFIVGRAVGAVGGAV
ncbi:geranylgeranylglycerol-phosphate geranylgeranyltransferase [Halobellus salinus]|uniref:Digeranylgeranylglyceryl phosphate synthase n=1 Tax=Halobellus salinus TaxID=931585 RepID=A0A830EK10_9EURY|nr:geranylgeranylglycerol-phosphate geranylgeranyltransferase [Halobellus salinus]GGI98632.1 geranylgeranylglycerol-phosphate geranylgeranyltransferase [Halobellus salinus]SMP05696.1 geranylgeranylglycerol-phosphate geranylgeranyltransferase [Halobellus salinus]